MRLPQIPIQVVSNTFIISVSDSKAYVITGGEAMKYEVEMQKQMFAYVVIDIYDLTR